MKPTKLLSTTALISALLLSATPTLAADKVASHIPPAKAGSFYLQQLNESSEMMGQIALARASLDLGMDDDALHHLKRAEKLAMALQKQSPEMAVTSTLRFGDQMYSFNNEYKDHLIPVVDDIFTVKDYDITVKRDPKKTKAAESDAGIERYQLSLNIDNVKAALNRATELTKKKEILSARTALNDIYKGAFESTAVYDNPIWAVHDNLMLANAMVKEKDYDNARFALKRAESGLKALQKHDDYAEDQKLFKRLEKEVHELHTALRKEDPNLLQKAGDDISSWLKNLRVSGKKYDKKAAAAKKK